MGVNNFCPNGTIVLTPQNQYYTLINKSKIHKDSKDIEHQLLPRNIEKKHNKVNFLQAWCANADMQLVIYSSDLPDISEI